MKTVTELMEAGGRWVDVRWQDLMKMPDGNFWKPISTIVDGDTPMFRFSG
ncbi:MAG: hypothetical protein KGZ83_01470 [Sulfuricella sp.]|nr:hypothetical protein [Sulfuricella sp.]